MPASTFAPLKLKLLHCCGETGKHPLQKVPTCVLGTPQPASGPPGEVDRTSSRLE